MASTWHFLTQKRTQFLSDSESVLPKDDDVILTGAIDSGETVA